MVAKDRAAKAEALAEEAETLLADAEAKRLFATELRREANAAAGISTPEPEQGPVSEEVSIPMPEISDKRRKKFQYINSLPEPDKSEELEDLKPEELTEFRAWLANGAPGDALVGFAPGRSTVSEEEAEREAEA